MSEPASGVPVSAEQRLSYADLESPAQMRADCRGVGRSLGLGDDASPSTRERRLGRVARSAVQPAPSIRFEDYPREVPKRGIRVDEAARRIAGAIFD